jgi:hypothetical protein
VLILIIIITVLILFASGWNKLGKAKPYTLTLRDLLITVLCSIFPILLASLIKSWFTPETFESSFLSSFKQGQAFLYTSAFLSAFFVLYVKDSKKPPGWVLCMLLISGLGGALLYTFDYSSQILKLNSYAQDGLITTFELSIISCVCVVWFWSTLPSNFGSTSGAAIAQKQQEDLENKFKSKENK